MKPLKTVEEYWKVAHYTNGGFDVKFSTYYTNPLREELAKELSQTIHKEGE